MADEIQTAPRDFDTHPYSLDERRVADWLLKRTGGMVGTGDDPIGFVLASYEAVHAEKATALAALRDLADREAR